MTSETSTQKRIHTALFYGIAILLAYLAYRVFEPFLQPLAWAAVLAVVTFPVHARLARRWGPTKAALVSTTGVTLILIVPTIFLLKAFLLQAVSAVQSVQFQAAIGHHGWLNRFWVHLQSRFPGLIPGDLGQVLHRYFEQGAAYLAAQLGNILRHTAEFILDLSFTILAMFYFFRDGESMVNRLRSILPFEPEQRMRVLDDTRSLIFAGVISSLISAAFHGVVGGVTFALTGIRAPIFWAVLMGFFSLIPYIGTALIWVPLSASLILGGQMARGIVLAVVCGVMAGTADNFLRPLLISERAEINTLLIFIGALGGISVFGLLGVVLGPIIIAIAAILLDFYVPRSRAHRAAPHPLGRSGGPC